jgi:hypothetical protein
MFDDANFDVIGGRGEVAADQDEAAVAGEALEYLIVARRGEGDGLLSECVERSEEQKEWGETREAKGHW